MRKLVIMGAVAAALPFIAPPSPAGADPTILLGVSPAVGDPQVITMDITGAAKVSIECPSGLLVVRDETTGYVAPPVSNRNCSTITWFNVYGDNAAQEIDGTDLEAAAFAAKPKLTAQMGGGDNKVTETKRADSISLGDGNDTLTLVGDSVANTTLSMGNGTADTIVFNGTNDAETLAATSTGTSTTINSTIGATNRTWTVTGPERLTINGNSGGDSITTSGVTAASSLGRPTVDGGSGDDLITSGVRGMTANGRAGSNTFNLGTGQDVITSESQTDTVNASTDSQADSVNDAGLRFGGRSLTGFGNATTASDVYGALLYDNDTVLRVRPGEVTGQAVVTASTNKVGQQVLVSGIEQLIIGVGGSGALAPKSLGDVVAVSQNVRIAKGQLGGTELLDVTIPTGSWTETDDSALRTFATSSSSLGDVQIPSGATYVVHGPWANKNQSFAHRIYRDLLFRFASNSVRDQLRDQLAAGTTTRSAAVASLVDTDEYRGLDVDRVFHRYLRRKADPGGRTYWIGSIRNGKSLRQFRAQLLGGSEYFSKAGGTNAAFVVRAYQDVLGRAPDASGATYWTNKANNGTDRGLIARQFLDSNEARRTIVRDLHLRFLDREPTADEITTWTAALTTSATAEQDLVKALGGSNAYYDRT